MAVWKFALVFMSLYAVRNAQRPFYSGHRPIGFPEIESNEVTDGLDKDADLPIEAGGDKNLINRIEQFPEDNRPFWYLNARHYDELRKNPLTYQLRPNGFVDINAERK